jgi:uncharacterized protein (TIGR04255 family)
MKQGDAFKLDLSEPFPHLPRAPIVEAVIHWVARAGKPLSQEELRKQLAERLPEYPDCQPQQRLEFEAQIVPDGSSTQLRRDSWHGFRLTSADKLQIAQFSRDGLVFSRQSPYQNWDVFAAEAQRVWAIFVELAQPSEIHRLGLRFINRVCPLRLDEIGEYLAKPPKCLETLGLPTKGFLYQSMHDVPGRPFQVNVVQTVQPLALSTDDGFGLILDIDVFTTQPFPSLDETMREFLPQMRWLKNKTFFMLMSKKAIKSFAKGPK